MKQLNITFTNKEFRKLYKIKPRSWTWRAFINAASNLFKIKFEKKF